MTKKITSSAFFWFLLGLSVVELVFHFSLPYHDQPAAADVHRNPTPMRGWPEYLRPVRADPGHARRIAIVGNSQAVGREINNEQILYAARLQALFDANNDAVKVENWSVEGLSSDQIELLSMQAARRGIDLLVIIVSPSSIDLGSH